VYNYGTFDDSDPNFYVKFTKGIMRYALSNYSFQEFLQEYQYEKRGVIEQNLQLTGDEKQRLYAALRINALEENRYYNYYFHLDNCTTRARDIIEHQTGAAVVFKNILPAKTPTFRNLIHTYLNGSGMYWSKFGIDVLLGSNFDKKVTNEEAMFLPDYLLKGVDSAMADNHPLVAQKQSILPFTGQPSAASLLTPMVLFCLLLVVAAGLSFSNSKWAQRVLNVFDAVFFLFLGIIGVLIVTLWTIRVDTVCRNNFNMIWALPTHLPVAFVVYLKRKWLQQYFRVVFVLTALFAVCWLLIPQQINTAVLPLLGIIGVRSYFRGNRNKKKLTADTTTNASHSRQSINVEL
ncbi:MAG TPA: DUF4105 domain-containing protein, partial [Niastella sp.]